jgi:hypothetical protein
MPSERSSSDFRIGPQAIFFNKKATTKKATVAQKTVPYETLNNPSMDLNFIWI